MTPHQEGLLNIFYRLSAKRPRGMGVQPIPSTELVSYFRLHPPIDLEERKDIIEVMEFLDMVYLEVMIKKEQDEIEEAKEGSG